MSGASRFGLKLKTWFGISHTEADAEAAQARRDARIESAARHWFSARGIEYDRAAFIQKCIELEEKG
jgi:hypothetical protein